LATGFATGLGVGFSKAGGGVSFAGASGIESLTLGGVATGLGAGLGAALGGVETGFGATTTGFAGAATGFGAGLVTTFVVVTCFAQTVTEFASVCDPDENPDPPLAEHAQLGLAVNGNITSKRVAPVMTIEV
jgi:hypothetical protein